MHFINHREDLSIPTRSFHTHPRATFRLPPDDTKRLILFPSSLLSLVNLAGFLSLLSSDFIYPFPSVRVRRPRFLGVKSGRGDK